MKTAKKKEKCYRYTAPVDDYAQAVFGEPPKKPCIFYWNNKKEIDGRKIGKWWGDKQ